MKILGKIPVLIFLGVADSSPVADEFGLIQEPADFAPGDFSLDLDAILKSRVNTENQNYVEFNRPLRASRTRVPYKYFGALRSDLSEPRPSIFVPSDPQELPVTQAFVPMENAIHQSDATRKEYLDQTETGETGFTDVTLTESIRGLSRISSTVSINSGIKTKKKSDRKTDLALVASKMRKHRRDMTLLFHDLAELLSMSSTTYTRMDILKALFNHFECQNMEESISGSESSLGTSGRHKTVRALIGILFDKLGECMDMPRSSSRKQILQKAAQTIKQET